MATKSRIVEDAFRLGVGRYIQEEGAIARLGAEVTRLNKKRAFIIGGKTALSLTESAIKDSLSSANIEYVFYLYEEFCNIKHAEKIVASEEYNACDIVIGVGGGNIMDVAKLCAVMGNRPIINIPTSSATCAAYTPLSVTYNERGQTVGTRHHAVEVNAVIVDMDILCRQPVRLLLSGVYDAMAKVPETSQRLLGKSEDEVDIGLRSSFVLSQFIYDRMLADLPAAVKDTSEGKCTKAVYDIVYLAIAVTGLISSLARGSNQCAIAHKIYEACRTLYPEITHPYLHGEMVAIGMISQMIYNGDSEETVNAFRAQMQNYGMPVTLTELGIPADEAVLNAYYESVANTPALAGVSDEEKKRFRASLDIIK